jgi:hypothetical protein
MQGTSTILDLIVSGPVRAKQPADDACHDSKVEVKPHHDEEEHVGTALVAATKVTNCDIEPRHTIVEKRSARRFHSKRRGKLCAVCQSYKI